MECGNCQIKDTELQKCGACKLTSYCSKECQVSNWQSHKLTCKIGKLPFTKTNIIEEEKIDQETKKKIIEEQENLTLFPKAQNLLKELGYMEDIDEQERKRQDEHSKNPIHDYEVLEEIGTGNFTSIHKALEKKTGRFLAMKIAEKRKLVKKHKESDLLVEKHCLNKTRNIESIVKLEKTFQDENNLYIVMELIEGKELWELMNIFGFKSKKKTYFYFNQILKAVNELHKIGIVHRDLKPENVLVKTADNLIKIIDFGSSKDLIDKIASKGNSSTGRKYFEHFMGTPNYMAHECIHNRFSDERCDVYSLGCLFYNLVVGQPPFVGGSEYLIFKSALENKIRFFYFLFDEDVIHWVSKMLEHDAEKRPTITEILFFFNEKEKMLKEDNSWVEILENMVVQIKKSDLNDLKKLEEFFDGQINWLENRLEIKLGETKMKELNLLKSQTKHFYKLVESFEPFEI